MKKYIFILVAISSITVNAQSLKDALFSGKLKTDSGTVIRKGDDLSSKIDTAKKKPVDSVKTKMTLVTRDSSMTAPGTKADSIATPNAVAKDNAAPDAVVNNAVAKDNNAVPNNSVAPRDNNKIWKEYVDSLTSTLKAEALPSKKIKSGTYYVLIEYEIGVDGQTTLNSLSCSPESSFLEQQIKERFTLTAPQMNPLLAANGKPHKVIKKYTLTLSKM